MSKDPLDELAQFLKPDSRVDLKHISLEYLIGVSATEEGVNTILKNESAVQSVIELTDDKVEAVAKDAFLVLVNITATPGGASEILKYKPFGKRNIVELLIGYILNPKKRDADAACMILSNMTHVENLLDVYLDTIIPHLNDILIAFAHTEYNKTGSNLDYIAPMICNLSRNSKVQKWLTEEQPHVPLIKLLPFCSYEPSNIRRGGVIGIIRNLSFDIQYHDFLLSVDLDILTYLLNALMGGEDYPDEEMDMFPIGVQYLPREKKREPDVDIRKMILETLNKFCTKRKGREVLRTNGVYYILREYHKWEMDPKVRLVCENVVDILIQKEEEVGAEDLSQVEVPEHIKERFEKMDEEYIATENT